MTLLGTEAPVTTVDSTDYLLFEYVLVLLLSGKGAAAPSETSAQQDHGFESTKSRCCETQSGLFDLRQQLGNRSP